MNFVVPILVLVLCVLLSGVDMRQFDFLIFHPERPHYTSETFVSTKSDKLFEGWYYKIASVEHQIAIIPGAYHSKHESYAFIMYVTSQMSLEYRYPLSEYKTPSVAADAIPGQFYVNIGNNKFSREKVELDLSGSFLNSVHPKHLTESESGNIKATFDFSNMDNGFPVTVGFLGAMGYYGWLPFLECYHGILSMNFEVNGWVQYGTKTQLPIKAYNGYLEKDWGTNFPQTWIWLQANSFTDSPGTSLTLALARLPIIGDSVLSKFGFLGGFYHKGELHQFGTYTWASVSNVEIEDDYSLGRRHIFVSVTNFLRNKSLKVSASIPLDGYSDEENSKYPKLMVPSQSGRMLPQLLEWVDASLSVAFYDGVEQHIFTSRPATVECHSPDNKMIYMTT